MQSDKKLPSLSEYDIQVLLVLEHEAKYVSNSLIARILRKYPSGTRRVLRDLKRYRLVRQDFFHGYKISKKGLELIKGPKYNDSHYDKVRNLVKHLKDNPEKEGWRPSQFDNGDLTLLESAILYLFEKEDSLFNAEIARMLDKFPESTWKELESLVQKNLLAKNEYDAGYHVTQEGLELIGRNVSKNILCKYIREYAISLKKDPTERELCVVLIAGLTTLGLASSSTTTTAFAASSAPIAVTPVIVAPAATTTTTATATAATAGTATTVAISSKTVLASIVATILVVGGGTATTGVYFGEPEAFANTSSLPVLLQSDKSSISNSNSVLFSPISTTSLPSSSGSASNASVNSKSISSHISSDISSESTQIKQSQETSINSKSGGSSSGSLATDKINDLNGPIPPDLNGKPVFEEIVTNFEFDDLDTIAVDSEGNIYVLEHFNNRIQIFDSAGNFITKFGEYGQDDGQFDSPEDVAVDSEGNIYVVDGVNNRIQVFDSEGNHKLTFGEEGDGPGQFDSPEDVAVDSEGNIYVLESANNRIQIFDSRGDHKLTFGEEGDGPGQFDSPENMAVDSEGNIYVFDDENARIQIFDSRGDHKLTFGEEGDGPGQFDDDSIDMAVDSEGNIYVIDDDRRFYVQVFDSNGKYIRQFGDDSDQFNYNAAIAIGPNGNIYVIDGGGRIVQISFEDAIATFSEKLEEIKCNADSMINDPVQVAPEIAAALPISELLPRANSLTFDTQRYEEGLLFYYIISQIQPTNVNAWNGIGYTQTQICSNDSAETAYLQTLSIDKDNINAKIGLADFIISQISREGNASILKLEDAELQLQSVLDFDPYNTNARNALGYIEILRENYSKSISHYQDSLKINSKKTAILNGLAFAHLRSDNLGEATTTYLKVLNVDPNNFDALIGLITTHTQQGFPELAEEFIDKLDESNGIVADKLIEQGNWLLDNGQAEEAQRLFDAADRLKN